MNITVDGILGSARKINQKRTTAAEGSTSSQASTKKDSVEIGGRLNGRLEAMQSDLKITQSSLTRNQIVQEGLKNLLDDIHVGGGKQKEIVGSVTYNGENPLKEMIADKPLDEQFLSELMKGTMIRINKDIADLSRMQIESENIFASNLANSPSFELSDMLAKSIISENMTKLNADVVMRLTK